MIEHKVYEDAVFRIALSGDMIVASDNVPVIRVLNIRTCSLVLLSCGVFMMSYGAVMIKQFPEDLSSCFLAFHGDVVYIGSLKCVIQWNVVTDAVVRLEGYPGLSLIHFSLLGFTLPQVWVRVLDISFDGNVAVGASTQTVIAHNTATGLVLWRKEMPGWVWALRIHGGLVVVPADSSNTIVIDVTTGHQLHTLPSAGQGVRGICVFDGLISDEFDLLVFSHVFLLAPLTKVALIVDQTIADSGSGRALCLRLSLAVFFCLSMCPS